MGRNCLVLTMLVCSWSACAAAAEAPSADSADVEFFGKRIRPILAENCYQCHGAKKQESGLVLSSTTGVQKGGDRGLPIVPGQPDESILIQAVRYAGDDLKMPPRGKLKEEQIADLVAWVKMGAPLPLEGSVQPAAIKPSSDFNLAERRKHWAYQPVQRAEVPVVATPGWCASSIDNFILGRLEAAGLSPASAADNRVLIRRLTFDLTGLPPTPPDVAAFLADSSPDAYERLVDRLLASPRYGERWARHWLDVVRYCETLGFEFDYDLYNVWRYRDYVIRAFNADLPYDQFVIDHLAGDLVLQPRRSIDGDCNESILATGFFWMLEGKQTPVDIRQEQADRIDNQIDTLGKAFLGQTIACARCHDHKFDAISTRDYYALAGYLKSSRFQQAFIDPPQRTGQQIRELSALKQEIRQRAVAELGAAWQRQLSQAGSYLLAASSAEPEKTAGQFGLDAARAQQWTKALQKEDTANPDHPLYGWVKLSREGKDSAAALPQRQEQLQSALREQAERAKRFPP